MSPHPLHVASEPEGLVRPEIAQSWRRSLACGLRPDAPLNTPELSEFDGESRLLRAAAPVLNELEADLNGTSFVLMLADREACIVDRRFGDVRLENELDGIGAVLGRRFTEETTGTNSIATAIELRHGVAVNGAEHFMIPMKRFSCYGQTVVHPVSRRVEAVLQITGPVGDENALWAPIVNRAASDIGQRLLAGTRLEEQRMLDAFQAAGRRNGAVIVLGEDIFMASPAAVGLLDAPDHALLREIADGTRGTPVNRRRIALSSGIEVGLSFRRLPNALGGVLFELTRDQPDRQPVPRRRGDGSWARHIRDELDRCRRHRVRVLIAGEPGSGRTWATELLGGNERTTRLDATRIDDVGARAWLAELAEAAEKGQGLVVVESIHLLPPAVAVRVGALLSDSSTWYAMTSAPMVELAKEHAALATTCGAQIEIPPLRFRQDELPGLVRALLGDMSARAPIRMTPQVWEALRCHPWPGNIRELAVVVRHVLEHRRSDSVAITDLPSSFRWGSRRRLSPLEQAEHDTIVRALEQSSGNKVHASETLGISRTTLYSRMRRLGIDR